MSDSAARGERTPVGVGRHRCTQPGKGSVLVELRGGFGWYCFVFVLDAADPAGGSGILCMGGAAGAGAGATLGAALGATVSPGLGAVIGGPVGAVLGGVLGFEGAVSATKWLNS